MNKKDYTQSNEYNEIDLIDYIRVIKNNFKFITLFTIAVIIITGLLTYFVAPKKYELEGVIKIGVTENNTPLTDPEKTIEIIKQRSSLSYILNNLKEKDKFGLWENYNYISPNSFSTNNQNIFLTIIAKNDNPQKSKELIEEISNFIIEQDKKIYEKNIKAIDRNIKISKEQIVLTGQKLALIRTQLNENNILLNSTIQVISGLSVNSQANSLALQGYLASRDNIKGRVDDYKHQINNLEEQIKNISDEIENFELQKQKNESTQINTYPVIPQSPLSPSLKVNLIIALILGLFIGILISFIMEWWKKNKRLL